MKRIFKTAVLFGVIGLLSTGASAADIDIVAPKAGFIGVTKINGTDIEVSDITADLSKNVIVTNEGSIIVLGGAKTGEITLTGTGNDVSSVKVHSAIECDFDDKTSDLISTAKKSSSGNTYAAATADKNLVIDTSSINLTRGILNVEFDVLLEAKKTNLISICNADGNVFAEAELRFRRDNAVYVAHKKDKYNYTPLRDKLISTGGWVTVCIQIDMDSKTFSLKNGGEVLFEDAPFVTGIASGEIESIRIGAYADNITISSGEITDSAELKILTDNLNINTAGSVVSVLPTAQIKTVGAFENVAPEYFSWEAEDNSVCTISQTGELIVDAAALSQVQAVRLKASAILGSSVTSAEKDITLTPSDSGGEAVAISCVTGASISKSSGINSGDTLTVKVPVYNPTAQSEHYYVVVTLQDNAQKNIQNYVFKADSPANSNRVVIEKSVTVSEGSNLSAKVFVMDKEFCVNVLKK